MKTLRLDCILTSNKIDAMKLFETVQKFYRLLCIHPCQKQQFGHPLNAINITIAFVFSQICIIATISGIYGSANIVEYGISFFSAVTGLGNTIYFTTNLWRMVRTIELIEKFEGIIQTSKRILREISFSKNNIYKESALNFYPSP